VAIPEVKVRIGADVADLERGLNRAKQSLANLEKIAVASTLAAATGLAALTKASFESIDATGKMARNLGIGVQQFQALSLVASEAGVDAGAFSASVGIMQRNITGLADGTAAQVDAFGKLGLSIEDLQDLAPDRQFIAISEALDKIENPTQRTALAMDVFGRSGRSIIGMLGNMNEKVEQAANYQKAFGIQVSDDTVRAVESANDAIGRLMGIFTGLGNTMAAKIAPALNQFVLNLEQTIIQAGGLDAVLVKVGNAFGYLIEVLKVYAGFKLVQLLAASAMAFVKFGRAIQFAAIAMIAMAKATRTQILALATIGAALAALVPGFEGINDAIDAMVTKAYTLLPLSLTQGLDSLGSAIDGLSDLFNMASSDAQDFTGAIADANAAAATIGNAPRRFITIGGSDVVPPIVGGLKAVKKAVNDISDPLKDMELRLTEVGTAAQNAFANVITGATSGREALRQFLASMSRTFANRAFAALFGNFFAVPSMAVPSLEGGGFTGSGPRTGGVDGRGGFPAILHPNETVIDHTRGHSAPASSVVVHQTINVTTGVQQTVRAEIRSMLPQIAEASKAAVLDARRRGGNYYSAFG